MNAFCTLLPHQAQTNTPLLQPSWNMTFQDVHFWQDCCVREVLVVVPHETIDVCSCNAGTYMYIVKSFKVVFSRYAYLIEQCWCGLLLCCHRSGDN